MSLLGKGTGGDTEDKREGRREGRSIAEGIVCGKSQSTQWVLETETDHNNYD